MAGQRKSTTIPSLFFTLSSREGYDTPIGVVVGLGTADAQQPNCYLLVGWGKRQGKILPHDGPLNAGNLVRKG